MKHVMNIKSGLIVALLSIVSACSEDKSVGPKNEAPEPSFTFTTPSRPNKDLTFDASGSVDKDGSIANATWSFGDGTSATGLSVTKKYTSTGTYSVTLTVSDNLGLSATLTQSVVVQANKSPVARFTYSAQTYYDQPIIFDAGQSSDDDGTISSVEWRFGDGSTSTSTKLTKRFRVVGNLNVQLIVRDNEGASSDATRSLNIQLTGSSSECDSWDGHYSWFRRWVSGTTVSMYFSNNLVNIDRSWSSVDQNSFIFAMAEWYWNSGAKLDFRYYQTLRTGVGAGNDGRNTVWTERLDGVGGVLAETRSWYSTSSGYLTEADVVVDNSETWGPSGLNLVATMVHEFGHVWGLGHVTTSTDRWESMFYAYFPEAATLYCGDKRGVKSLYGAKSPEFEDPFAAISDAAGIEQDNQIPEPPSLLVEATP